MNATRRTMRECVEHKRLMHRIDEVVSIVPITGCWMWMGVIAPSGYGQTSVWDGTRTIGIRAHRVTYTQTKGAIPDGAEIDHLCRNRWCVNPAHLEAVTPTENRLRGEGVPARNARKTHCRRGHPLSGSNVYLNRDGGRVCRACKALEREQRKCRLTAERGVA